MSLLVAYATLRVDSPAGIVTWSAAFVTDEGFHSKWAQNAVRFGTYSAPYDFSFVPAGFLHNLAVLGVFGLFGASFEVARLYAGFLSGLALVLYIVLLRHAPPRFRAWQALAILVITINYVAYARVLFIEPLGLVFSLAALLFAVGSRATATACALSVTLAFLAFLTKVHFADIIGTVAVIWLLRLTVWNSLPRGEARRIASAFAVALAVSCLATIAVYVGFRDLVAEFASIAGSQMMKRGEAPLLLKVARNQAQVFAGLYANTHHAAFFASLALATAALVWAGARRVTAGHPLRALFPASLTDASLRLSEYKLDVAMVLWLLFGILVRGIASYQPPRYFYPLLFPLSYLAVRLLATCGRQYAPAFAVVLLIHGYAQAPPYWRWLYRKDVTTQYANRVSFAREIESRAPDGMVALLGGDAATYSLFGTRMRPIDLDYVPANYTICDRVGHWRPRFFVASAAHAASLSVLRSCAAVASIDEIRREYAFGTGERILYAVSYR